MNDRAKTIYIANTGGTIGMRLAGRGYAPEKGFLAAQMANMPEFRRPELPCYEIEEMEPLLDSSNIRPPDWMRLARAIFERYDDYDGFVVIHGTDTMTYSASALSFILEGLAKPVIFTGSQIPLVEVRSDARENLITSLLIAAEHPVPEVCISFGDSLFRANRTTKVSSSGFRAFDSPNYPPLGRAGVRIRIDRDLVFPTPKGHLKLHEIGHPQVADIRVYPGITGDMLRRFLSPPLAGAVLHTYGAGNAPGQPDILDALREACSRGVVIVNCTQCLNGSVDMRSYAAGNGLLDAGVVSGYDMNPEAALTKLFFLLSHNDDPEMVRRLMGENLRGELTRSPAKHAG